MELVTGGTLDYKIKDQSVSFDVITMWWTQIATALHYMHFDNKIQHRDIKPRNIMLTSNGNIKIIDLGLACMIKSKATHASKVGTSTYYSFEKACELPYDSSDVWAAGCVIAELMTKTRLVERGGPVYMYNIPHINDRRLKLISDCVAVNYLYGRIIGRMLEPEQENRCNSKDL